jgi:hypothetical protein
LENCFFFRFFYLFHIPGAWLNFPFCFAPVVHMMWVIRRNIKWVVLNESNGDSQNSIASDFLESCVEVSFMTCLPFYVIKCHLDCFSKPSFFRNLGGHSFDFTKSTFETNPVKTKTYFNFQSNFSKSTDTYIDGSLQEQYNEKSQFSKKFPHLNNLTYLTSLSDV